MQEYAFSHSFSKSLPLQHIASLLKDGAAPGAALAYTTLAGDTFSTSFGYFDNPPTIPVTEQTPYDVASITKLFTAALILRLHEQQQLSLFDLCANYLPNFAQSQLRLLDLITHQANFNLRLSEYRSAYPTPDQFWQALENLIPPAFASSSIHYENIGYLYLGRILEHVTGQCLQEQVYKLCHDLNMKAIVGSDLSNIQAPPTEIDNEWQIQGITHDETARLLGGLAGNAGIFLSAPDLARFGLAWLQDKLCSSETLTTLVFSDYDPSGSMPQAFSWWLRIPARGGTIRKTPKLYSHTGFTGSLLVLDPIRGLACAFVCNRTYYGRANQQHRVIWQTIIDWIQALPR